ncbi:NDP-sugar synthase [Candidatus Acetothermia bacterium]|jgi:bifunctional UDP-N-acetylglucosamine pyrophosphorylase/glucosamine-1-phosphate N-acetyltransferase|nr:NDP-sugar synthase [Candidatus Acetothermia bacterium]MCI2431478.1 NDP-sugar synthase [Candidatus Acetothermia bacterium]MCI2436440.1 NDP-sugar synthase [Candidatus Acetothermia bacterium]
MQAVILAAGESSRFWPLAEGAHKSLFSLLGKPIIVHTLAALQRAQIEEILIVQSPDRALERGLGDGSQWRLKLSYAVQEQPRGMGDALRCAQALLRERFLVLNPQHISGDRLISRLMQSDDAPAVLVGCPTERPQEYGMLKLEGDRVIDLIEKPAPGTEPSRTRVAGIYLLSQSFFDFYRRIPEHPYAFEEALREMMRTHSVRVLQIDEEPPTLKYPWDLFALARRLMDKEITEQKIAPSAQIHKSALIEGPVWIGEQTKILEHAVIKGPCYIGNRCIIGTGSLVRDYANLEDGTVIGAHAEVARSIFEKDCSTHSGYFGDSIFAEGVKIGAGTVTANVRNDRKTIRPTVKGQRIETGLHKLGAIVGRETHIGICAMLMPGVLIGARCEIGPGTLVLKNVESNTRYYAKPKQIISQRR